MWECVRFLFCYTVLCVLSTFCWRREAGCFTFIVFWMSWRCYSSLHLLCSASGWSVVYDCGIFWSYSLTFYFLLFLWFTSGLTIKVLFLTFVCVFVCICKGVRVCVCTYVNEPGAAFAGWVIVWIVWCCECYFFIVVVQFVYSPAIFCANYTYNVIIKLTFKAPIAKHITDVCFVVCWNNL